VAGVSWWGFGIDGLLGERIVTVVVVVVVVVGGIDVPFPRST